MKPLETNFPISPSPKSALMSILKIRWINEFVKQTNPTKRYKILNIHRKTENQLKTVLVQKRRMNEEKKEVISEFV